MKYTKLSTVLLASRLLACETRSVPPAEPAIPPAPAALAPSASEEYIDPGAQQSPSDPACGWKPRHGDFCFKNHLTCSWRDSGGLTAAYCDERNWIVAVAEPGCPARPPTGACGFFARECQYLPLNPSGTADNGCRTFCTCKDGTWNCPNECRCKPADMEGCNVGDYLSGCEMKGDVPAKLGFCPSEGTSICAVKRRDWFKPEDQNCTVSTQYTCANNTWHEVTKFEGTGFECSRRNPR